MTTFAITGASGTLGRLTADALLDQVAPADVVLVSRNPDALGDYAARGAQTRRGDFDDPSTLADAFAGVDRLLLISTDVVGSRVEGHLAAVDAAAVAGVQWIGYTSIPDPSDSNPAAVAAEHRATEDHLRASGVTWTFLRNAIYTEMLFPTAEGAIASGTLTTNIGDGATTYVSRADCAAVAAAVLVDDRYDGQALDVTGPEPLDAAAQAALFSSVSGKDITVTHLDDAAWIAAMVEHAGLPEPVAAMLATFGAAARLGYADSVSTVIEDVTGRPPIPAREILGAALRPAAT